mmetsp:Transcript_97415/g.281050  ORF Transcript_97415/g.281050 Transcript_97415/m.281050 type:complete len:285 (-) Transcript_97415:213-1067(-)
MRIQAPPTSSEVIGGSSFGKGSTASDGQYTNSASNTTGLTTRPTPHTVKRAPPMKRRHSDEMSMSLTVAADNDKKEIRGCSLPTRTDISVFGLNPPFAMAKAASKTAQCSPAASRMLFAKPLPLPDGMWPIGICSADSASGRAANPFKTSETRPSPDTTMIPVKRLSSCVAAYSPASPLRAVEITVTDKLGTRLHNSWTCAQSLGAEPFPLTGLTKTRKCRSACDVAGHREQTDAAQASAAPRAKTNDTSPRVRPEGLCGQCTMRTVAVPLMSPGTTRTSQISL